MCGTNYWTLVRVLKDFKTFATTFPSASLASSESGSDAFRLPLVRPGTFHESRTGRDGQDSTHRAITCRQSFPSPTATSSSLPRSRPRFTRRHRSSKHGYVFYTPSPELTCLRNVIGRCPIAWASPMLALMTSVKGFFPPCSSQTERSELI